MYTLATIIIWIFVMTFWLSIFFVWLYLLVETKIFYNYIKKQLHYLPWIRREIKNKYFWFYFLRFFWNDLLYFVFVMSWIILVFLSFVVIYLSRLFLIF